MPVYEFQCPKCGKTRMQTLGIVQVDEFKAVCECGETMKRVYRLAGVNFKGSGFYSTDKK